MTLNCIEAVILAGGLGTRLREVVSDRPKGLAEVRGRPFLFFLLDQLCDTKVGKVTICTGYMGEQIEEIIGLQYRTLQIGYSYEDEPLGTGGGLQHAARLFDSSWILVMNGDSFVEIDFEHYFAWHAYKQALISLVVVSVEDVDRYGSVIVDSDEKVTQFHEKCYWHKGQGYINAGIYLMHKSVVDSLPNRQPYSIEKNLLPSRLKGGLYGYRSKGKFIDIGTPSSYRSAEEFFWGM